MKSPKILILTLYSGENELEQCITALERQTYKNWEHRIFRYLPNIEAHRQLYRTIMSEAGKFDLFIKLDADMVFSNEEVVAEIVNLFANEPDLDHAVFAVRDWYSNTDIMGVHVYSNRVRWEESVEDRLFVDPDPRIPGVHRLLWDFPAPVADHSPSPSLQEAFLFGMHRALKIVQRDRKIKNIYQARYQLSLLQSVWKEFLLTKDLRRGAALLGSEYILSGSNREMEDKSKMSDAAELENIHNLGVAGVLAILEKKWAGLRGGIVLKWRKWIWIRIPKWFNRYLEMTARPTRQ